MRMAADSTGANDPDASQERAEFPHPLLRSQHDRLFGVTKQIAANPV
jgi:hypothetical protein